MTEIYIIEECLMPGVWIIVSDQFFTDYNIADKECKDTIEAMKKYKKGFIARVTKLKLNKK